MVVMLAQPGYQRVGYTKAVGKSIIMRLYSMMIYECMILHYILRCYYYIDQLYVSGVVILINY